MKDRFWHYFAKLEKIVIVLILLHAGGVRFFRPAYLSTTEGTVTSTATNIAIYAVTFLLITLRWKHFVYALTKEKLLLLVVAITLCSVLWSVNLESTLDTNKGLIRATALGVYIAIRYSLKEQFNVAAWTFGSAAVISLLYCLIYPDLGIQFASLEETTGWRGVFFHKNHFGRQMSYASAIFMIFSGQKSNYRWLWWTLLGISSSLLLLSNSKTVLLCFLVSIALLPIITIFRQSITRLLIIMPYILLFVIGLTASLWLNLESILATLGKDMTFTGRVPMWIFLSEKLAERPWFGYGHSAFWDAIKNDTGYLYSFNWDFGDAHNGFIEVALSIGIIGLTLFLLSFLFACQKAIALIRLDNSAENIWCLQFLIITLITNLTITTSFLETSSYWILFVSILFSLSLTFDSLQKANYRKGVSRMPTARKRTRSVFEGDNATY